MTETITAQALTTSPPDSRRPIEAVKQGLEQMRPQFALQLPSHIKPERFERTILTAINNNPDLLAADRRSLFNGCMKAAGDGLLPDGREGALVIFKDRTGRKLVTWMPMVFGLLKLIRQSGEIDSVGARIVYQKEIDDGRFKFVIEDGKEKLYHDPMLWGERGEKVLVYAYARFKESGHVEYAPLHRKDVEKRRAASRSSTSGPWQSWEDEMWLKTAIRAIAKRLPLSAEVMDRLDHDEEPTEFDRLRSDAIAQLGRQPAAALAEASEPYDIVERARAGFERAADLEELNDFAHMISAELEDEPLPPATKMSLAAEINACREAAKNSLPTKV